MLVSIGMTRVFRAARALAGAWIAALCTVGCGEEVDEAGARALWDEIHTANYRSWQRPAGWETRQPTVSAHGSTADIFINSVLVEAATFQGLGAWPDSSLLVKDSYRNDSLALIAAMKKTSGEWFFAEWSGDGEVKFAGRPDVCLDCHQAGSDHVFSMALP
jgi:hypothetical protein